MDTFDDRWDQHPPGTIALPCNDLMRYSAFVGCLATLDMPPGSRVAMHRSMDVTANLNSILREQLIGDWVWFQADDHVFEPDLLMRLLDRNVDVVTPMIVKRNPPFRMLAFSGEETQIVDNVEVPVYTHIDMADLPTEGLVKVHAAGSGGMLIRRHVLEEIGDPWFTNSSAATSTNDDLELCRKIRDLGYDIHLDVECKMGHISQYTVYPDRREGVWGVDIDFGGVGTNVIFLGSMPFPEMPDSEKLLEEALA